MRHLVDVVVRNSLFKTLECSFVNMWVEIKCKECGGTPVNSEWGPERKPFRCNDTPPTDVMTAMGNYETLVWTSPGLLFWDLVQLSWMHIDFSLHRRAVPVEGYGAALNERNSWRENSCNSDPGEREPQKNSHIKRQLDSTTENVNHGISLSSAGGLRDKQGSLLWMGVTLTPIKASLIT